MTDHPIDLSKLSPDKIRSMRANAEALLARNPNDLRAEKARQLLAAIHAWFEERTVKGAIKTFLEKFPGGFDDPLHRKEELDDKHEARDECQKRFAQAAFRRRLDSGDLKSLFEDAKYLIQLTTFIQGAVEKPKFIDAVRDQQNTRPFLEALFDSLHGPGDPPARLGRFADVLSELKTPDRYNLSRWTYASYFLFFHEPERNLFVKPTVIQKAMDLAHEPFTYDPRPTAENYAHIMAFAERLKEQIAVLEPRDMIDVQSFIWHMAPTGKWAED